VNIRQSKKKNIGKDFRFDPIPESETWTPAPVPIPEEFNRWRFTSIDTAKKVVRFTHAQGYFKDLPFEKIIGHEPDGRYRLKKNWGSSLELDSCQLVLGRVRRYLQQ